MSRSTVVQIAERVGKPLVQALYVIRDLPTSELERGLRASITLDLLRSVYVDDSTLAGAIHTLEKGWELIAVGLELDPPQPLTLYRWVHSRSFSQGNRWTT